jgi:hypothetical protein
VGALLFASVVYMASGIWHSRVKEVAVFLSSFLRKIKEAVVTSKICQMYVFRGSWNKLSAFKTVNFAINGRLGMSF